MSVSMTLLVHTCYMTRIIKHLFSRSVFTDISLVRFFMSWWYPIWNAFVFLSLSLPLSPSLSFSLSLSLSLSLSHLPYLPMATDTFKPSKILLAKNSTPTGSKQTAIFQPPLSRLAARSHYQSLVMSPDNTQLWKTNSPFTDRLHRPSLRSSPVRFGMFSLFLILFSFYLPFLPWIFFLDVCLVKRPLLLLEKYKSFSAKK